MKCRILPPAIPALFWAVLLALLCAVGMRPALAFGTIQVTVTPTVLLADGISTAIVSVQVNATSGRPTRDGTEVRFYTTAGTITQTAFTSAGVARATLTASSVPQTANVSVSAGLDTSVTTVPMVSKLVEASVGGRVMRIDGKYVAFSEDKRIIQADEQVRVRFRGITIEANSVQIDVGQDTVKALGKVSIGSDKHSFVGERLWLDLKSFEGYILAVGTRKWFSAYGLTELPERPKNLNPDFDLVDLSDSKLIWVGKQAVYVFDERVQVQGARAYVGGIKSIRMPYHEVDLNAGFQEAESQYVGVSSAGLNVNVPIFIKMSPDATTAVRFGYGQSTSGLGYFAQDRGLQVDLVEKYGFANASEGQAMLTDMADPSRMGFAWNHTQQVNKTTRVVTNLEFPEHRDMYGAVNLTSGLPIGTITTAASVLMPRGENLAKTLDFGFETKPKMVENNHLAISEVTSFFSRDAQDTPIAPGVKLPLQGAQYETMGVKFRPSSPKLPGGFTLDSSLTLQEVIGNVDQGLGPEIETQLRRALPNTGSFGIGLSYNKLATISDVLPVAGRLNSTLNIAYPITKKLKLAAMGNMGLDSSSRSGLAQGSYIFLPGWHFDLLETTFHMGGLAGIPGLTSSEEKDGIFNESDTQFGITRSFGSRDLSFYWSTRLHRMLFEFGASRF